VDQRHVTAAGVDQGMQVNIALMMTGFAPYEDADITGLQRGPRCGELVEVVARLHDGRLIRHGHGGNDGNGPRGLGKPPPPSPPHGAPKGKCAARVAGDAARGGHVTSNPDGCTAAWEGQSKVAGWRWLCRAVRSVPPSWRGQQVSAAVTATKYTWSPPVSSAAGATPGQVYLTDTAAMLPATLHNASSDTLRRLSAGATVLMRSLGQSTE
jgi:hypothetical protein